MDLVGDRITEHDAGADTHGFLEGQRMKSDGIVHECAEYKIAYEVGGLAGQKGQELTIDVGCE